MRQGNGFGARKGFDGLRFLVGSTLVFISVLTFVLLLDYYFPPNLTRAETLSSELLDRHGVPLRLQLTMDQKLRLPVRLAEVDPQFIRMLIAYEDQRFYSHWGIDVLAMARALWQNLSNAEVVSGGSTLTMQTARLLDPQPSSMLTKIMQVLRAWQLESRYNKEEILELYLTLAPYGGNLEGIRAATRIYFNKEPIELTLSESALLVALPQSPSRLHPVKQATAARVARLKVIHRILELMRDETADDSLKADWTEAALHLAAEEPLHLTPPALPTHALHLSDRLAKAGNRVTSCLDASIQDRMERIAKDAAIPLHPRASVALLVVDGKTSEVHAYVGGSDYFNGERAGQLDLIPAVRSPGSTLKPFIYAMAFDEGIAAPGTLILDAPTRFGRYSPANFEGEYFGTITLAEALRRSLNVPAVALLEAIGPVRFVSHLNGHGAQLKLPKDSGPPGLAVGLGGVGVSLENLTAQYRALATDGRPYPLQLDCGNNPPNDPSVAPVFSVMSRFHVKRILQTVTVPQTRANNDAIWDTTRIAYKTGTSYGFRDAWAIGFDARWTVGVWVGRADGTSHPGHYGHGTAAPILFRAFDELPNSEVEGTPPPEGWQLAWSTQLLPARLQQLGDMPAQGATPRLLFPLPDVVVWMDGQPVQLAAEGGQPPYTWIINGAPVGQSNVPSLSWDAISAGFYELTIVDAAGARDHLAFRLEEPTVVQALNEAKLRTLADDHPIEISSSKPAQDL